MLKTPNDWDAWNRQFKAEAQRRSLLDKIEGAEFLTAPQLPKPIDFQRQPQTRGSSAGPTGTTGSVSITDLSAEGRTSFQLSLSFYKAEKDLYDAERDALDKLQTWMTKTVTPRYMETCFEYSETVRVWYENLKKQVGTNEYTIKREIKDTYKHAIKPLTKSPKDIEVWIANWEQVMAKGSDREILFAKDVDEWFNDFLNAVNTLEPLWTKAYRLTKSEEVEKGTLSYRTLANDFRKAVQASRTDAKPSRVAKGSFGPTFAQQHAEEETYASDASIKAMPRWKRQSNKRTPDSQEAMAAGKGKRRHSRAFLPTGRQCRACEQRHDFRSCFYLFPNKAPEGFKPKGLVKQRVEENLKNDNSLAEEVKRLRKSMDNTTTSD